MVLKSVSHRNRKKNVADMQNPLYFKLRIGVWLSTSYGQFVACYTFKRQYKPVIIAAEDFFDSDFVVLCLSCY